MCGVIASVARSQQRCPMPYGRKKLKIRERRPTAMYAQPEKRINGLLARPRWVKVYEHRQACIGTGRCRHGRRAPSL